MREHAPAYWDAKNEVWALTRYDDVLAVEKDHATFSSHRAPRPHGDHLPMMISMDDARALASPQAREPRVHAAARARPRSDDPPHLHGDHRPGRAEGGVRLRLGHRRAAAALAHRRHARLPARVLRRPAAVVRRPDPGHDARPAARGRAGGLRGDARVPRVPARRHRRPPVEAAAGRPRQHPLLLPRSTASDSTTSRSSRRAC